MIDCLIGCSSLFYLIERKRKQLMKDKKRRNKKRYIINVP
nr:MAG TPA: hypothetical protein [Caudoviricetes sp.]